jgi:hypothetical protein
MRDVDHGQSWGQVLAEKLRACSGSFARVGGVMPVSDGLWRQ